MNTRFQIYLLDFKWKPKRIRVESPLGYATTAELSSYKNTCSISYQYIFKSVCSEMVIDLFILEMF